MLSNEDYLNSNNLKEYSSSNLENSNILTDPQLIPNGLNSSMAENQNHNNHTNLNSNTNLNAHTNLNANSNLNNNNNAILNNNHNNLNANTNLNNNVINSPAPAPYISNDSVDKKIRDSVPWQNGSYSSRLLSRLMRKNNNIKNKVVKKYKRSYLDEFREIFPLSVLILLLIFIILLVFVVGFTPK